MTTTTTAGTMTHSGVRIAVKTGCTSGRNAASARAPMQKSAIDLRDRSRRMLCDQVYRRSPAASASDAGSHEARTREPGGSSRHTLITLGRQP